MHPDFADWYRVVDPSADTELLGRRWHGIEIFCKTPSTDAILNLVRVHYSIGNSPQFAEAFRDVFKSIDETFPNRDNEELLAVLAGSCLAKLIEDGGAIADGTALAVVTARFVDRRQGAIADLLEHAGSYLHDRSLMRFEVSKPSVIKDVGVNSDNLKAKLEEYCKADANVTKLAPLLHALLTKLASVSSRLANSAKALNERQQLQQEELDILWWLFGEFSRDLNLPFAEVGMPAVSLVAPKELVDLLSGVPGPYSANAFIDKALSLAENELPTSISLYDAINSCDRHWRNRWVSTLGENKVEEICPVILAVRKSLETAKKTEWVSAFETFTGLKARQRLKPTDLSMQVYHEALLLRSLSALE